jgi:CSLREA domain-containing protein
MPNQIARGASRLSVWVCVMAAGFAIPSVARASATINDFSIFGKSHTVAQCVNAVGHEDDFPPSQIPVRGTGPFNVNYMLAPPPASEDCVLGSATASTSGTFTTSAAVSSSGDISFHETGRASTGATTTSIMSAFGMSANGEADSSETDRLTITTPTPYSISATVAVSGNQAPAVRYRLIDQNTEKTIVDQTQSSATSGTLQPDLYSWVVEATADSTLANTTASETDSYNYDIHLTIGGAGLVVDSTGDEPDANPGDGACASTAMPPLCTLRAALQELDAGSSTAPTSVTFNLPGAATTITPGSPLPAATQPALIDGTTNPGGRVVISGGAAGPTAGLQVDADGSTVRGLDVDAFDGAGIVVQASNVTIGGLPGDVVACAFPCNVIHGNVRPGIVVAGAGSGTNRIVGNRLTGNANPEIDLGNDGRTPNDSDDSDLGANGLLNFPVGVLGERDPVTGKVEISGVDAPADQGDTVDVYAQSSVSAASGAEPADYVGSTTVTATGGWKLDRPAGLPAGDNFYSATVTDSNDGTSELSPICGDPDGDGNPDSDGDGLCDDWETHGLDYDDDGTADLPLGSSFGASPGHKDLYLEVDAMRATPSYAPSQGAIDDVVAAFADAPVTNPSGGTGITLHVNDPGEGPVDDLVPEDRAMTAFGTGPHSLTGIRDGRPDQPCDGFFGTQAERSSPGCWKLLGARALVFRYALFAYSFEDPGFSGVTLGIGGKTLTVTLGQWSDTGVIVSGGGTTNCPTRITCSRVTDAATLMHELGHALGLHHGGRDDINDKPNYLSVMNYTFQFRDEVKDRPLDYSRWALPPLDENALFDANGILGGVDPAVRSAVTSEWRATGFAQHLLKDGMRACRRAIAPTAGPIAWDLLNPGEDFDQVRECPFPGPPSPPGPTLLDSADDWSDLTYSFRDQPGGLLAAGEAASDQAPEQTDEQIVERAAGSDTNHNGVNDLADACREAPGSQFADANGNGFADVCEADMNRLQAFPTQANGTGAGGGASGGAGPVTDTTPPVLSKLSANPSTVRLARARHKARNATLRFTVSEPSLVTFTAVLVLPGHRAGKHCVAGRGHGRACTVYEKLAGSLRVDATPGQNTVAFSGRLAGRRLKPGRYRLTAVAIDAAGNRSNPARVTITVR